MAAADQPDPGTARPITILVVDDSRTIRRLVGRTLMESGYVVVEASDGKAALEVWRSVQPDLILLDVDMPVMDGPTALQQMRAEYEAAVPPVLFLTARTGAADVAAGLDIGAQDYIRKPVRSARADRSRRPGAAN